MQKARQYLRKNVTPSFSKKTRLVFFVLSMSLFILFLTFTFIVRSDALRSWDFNTTVRLQDQIPLRLDPFLSWFSVFGRFETTLIILLVILFLKRKILGIIPFSLFGFAHIIEIIGKTTLLQPGPPHMFLRTHELAQEFPGLYIYTQASYPSGHSMRTVFLSILIAMLIFRSKRIPTFIKVLVYLMLVGIVVIMLISRVSLGEHWATDVIGGALLGASFAFLSLLFL